MHKTRNSIVIATIVLITLAVLLITFVSLRHTTISIRSEAEKRLLLEAENLSNQLNLSLQDVETGTLGIQSLVTETIDLQQFMTDPDYRENYANSYGPLIRNIAINAKQTRIVAAYIFFDPGLTGEPFVISYGSPNKTTRLQKMPQPSADLFFPENPAMNFYYQPIKTHKAVWSKPYYWDRLDMKLLTYSSPVYLQGKLIGVAGLDISFSEFETYVRSKKIFDSGYAFLVSHDMDYLVHPTLSTTANLATLDGGAYTFMTTQISQSKKGIFPQIDFRGVDKIGAFAKLKNGFTVITVVPQKEVFASERQHTFMLIMLSGLIGILMSGLAYFASKSITSPLEKASQHADMLATRLVTDLPEELLLREDEVGIISRAVHEVLLQHTLEMRQNHLELIQRLSQLGEYRDTDTGMHVIRVGHYSALFGELLGMSAEEVEALLYATPMHDIGKVGLPDSILHKEGPLDDAEMEQMKEHTLIGAQILAGGDSPLLEMAYNVALGHHEWWDGSGYLNGLAREEIALAARICGISDAFDAMTSNRPYRQAMSFAQAAEEIKTYSGTQFDPQLVSLFLDNLDAFYALYREYQHNK